MNAISSLLCCFLFASLSCVASAEIPPPIFDGKSLAGWYIFVKDEGKSEKSDVVKVIDGVIRIGAEKPGYLSTEREFSNYELSFAYRWASMKASENKRNSGLLYHAIGEDRMWPNSMECQMQDGDAGDLWLIPGSGSNAAVTVNGIESGGTEKAARVLKSETNEKALGEWNEMKVVCRGNEFEHWVNGKKVLSGRTKDRTSGKIQFQAEGHEVWIRNLTLTPLTKH
jgi:hypothetical protein